MNDSRPKVDCVEDQKMEERLFEPVNSQESVTKTKPWNPYHQKHYKSIGKKNNYRWVATDQPIWSSQKNVVFLISEILMDRLPIIQTWNTIKAETFGLRSPPGNDRTQVEKIDVLSNGKTMWVNGKRNNHR